MTSTSTHRAILSEPGLNVTFLGISLRGKGPLQQAKVRPAIFWALDPQELLRESGVSGAPCDQLVPESIFGYLPQPDAGRPRLEMAKSLVAEAGYPRGFETTLEMPTASVAKLGPMLTKQLARVGITLNTVPLEWRDLSSRLDRRESPFFTIGWACYGDASDLFEAMLHTRRGDAWGTANFGEYSNPQLDAVIELAGRTMEPAARLRALHEAMRLSLQDVPLIPLFQRKRTYGVDERLHFVPRQNGQVVLFELSWVS